MKRLNFVAAALCLLISTLSSAGSYVNPTTTLAEQTANNTSAANTFATQTNGNRKAGNISKVDFHSLLYAGATTKVYAHLMVWFGGMNHMNVGYSSTDPAQVTRQINDMISRGINGVIIDWYGSGSTSDQAALLVMAEAEKHPGFTFAIMIDQGTFKSKGCTDCTQALITQLQYIEQTYFVSPAYMKQGGAPVVTNFDIDLVYIVDWVAANAALSSHPLFLFQNNGGFTHALSGGSYSWVMPTTTDYGVSYLASFYKTGEIFPTEQTAGTAYKGFNDSLAAWGMGRVMKQQCGQTWLKTFSQVNSLYNSGNQLPYLQLVTWNDYEEGTEIESGIDNCFTLSPTIAQNTFQWTITGSESTIDHYRVYLSTDGQNLMPLIDTAPGARSVNLCSFSIPTGSYKLLVQAVGKAGLANQITSSVNYSPSCARSGGGKTAVSFSASPSSVTIAAGTSQNFSVTATPESGTFDDTIALTCAGLPSTLSCVFSPAKITPGSTTAASTLTISAAPVTSTNVPNRNGHGNSLYATLALPFGLAGFALIGGAPRRRNLKKIALTCALAGITLVGISCGGKTTATQNAVSLPSSYAVTVNGIASSLQVAATVTVTVE
jgi:hypothetical protein